MAGDQWADSEALASRQFLETCALAVDPQAPWHVEARARMRTAYGSQHEAVSSHLGKRALNRPTGKAEEVQLKLSCSINNDCLFLRRVTARVWLQQGSQACSSRVPNSPQGPSSTLLKQHTHRTADPKARHRSFSWSSLNCT